MSSELRSRGLWGALLLAVALRAEYLRELSATPLGRNLVLDGVFYEQAARHILQGDPLAADPSCFRAPLYPFFLAAVRFFFPEGLLAPRLVMSMAMTILSLSMFARVTNISIRQLEPADLNPAAVWRGIDNQAHRLWNRGVKLYENFRLFYQIMSQLQAAEAEETAGEAAGQPAQPADPRRSEPARGSEPSP